MKLRKQSSSVVSAVVLLVNVIAGTVTAGPTPKETDSEALIDAPNVRISRVTK